MDTKDLIAPEHRQAFLNEWQRRSLPIIQARDAAFNEASRRATEANDRLVQELLVQFCGEQI